MRTLEDVARDSGITTAELERRMKSTAEYQAWRMLSKAPPHLTRGIKYGTLVNVGIAAAQMLPPPGVRSSTIEGCIMIGAMAKFLGLKKNGTPGNVTMSLDTEETVLQRSIEAAAVDQQDRNFNVTDRFESRDRLQRCWDAIDQLESELRQAIYLRWGIGCRPHNHRDAGKVVGRCHEIVRRREHKALAILALQGIIPNNNDLRAMVIGGHKWWDQLMTSALTLDEQRRMPTTKNHADDRFREELKAA